MSQHPPVDRLCPHRRLGSCSPVAPECALCNAERLRRDVPRNMAFERMWTVAVAEHRGAPAPVSLIRFAEQRAHGRILRDADRRDFGLEVLEELADARNYLVWWLFQLTRAAWRAADSVAAELTALIAEALSLVIAAFDCVARGRILADRIMAERGPLEEAA